jgi:PAT family beta-lactamase induction signal transducer AmpG
MERRPPKLWIFSILNMPHSVVIGGVAGTLLSYLLRQQGASPHSIANEYSLLLLPGALFFLWSPLSDFLLRRRTWVLVASAAAGVAVTLALQMKSYASSAAVALLFSAASLIYLSSAATGGLVAALVREQDKTRAGCFMQAGTLAGGALGGGGLLMLASHVDKLTLGVAAGAVVFAPAMLALLIDEPPIAKGGTTFAEGMVQRAKEFKRTFLRLSALPAVLLLVSPLGSGGALGILSSIAKDYGVSANLVALANGLGGAALTFAGAMVMTLMPARFDVRKAYAILGLINALSLGVFCFGTPKPWMYLAGSSLYLFTVGACWAMYSALVLKIVGAPGRSGSGRYAMAVSIANLPVAYMARLDGFGAKWFGPKGLPGIDMVFSATAAIAFLVWFWWERVKGFEVEIGLPEESSAEPAPLNA